MNLYLNGEFLELSDGRVSIDDRGFQFGDGVYEVIRVYNGRPFRLDAHLARLRKSAEGIRLEVPESPSEIQMILRQILGTQKESLVYLQVTRGAHPRIHTFPKDTSPTFLAYAREYKAAPADRAFTLKTVRDDRWGRCHLKTICLLANILGKQEAVEGGSDEGLFVREDGTVTEGTSTNVFFVRGGTVFTHPADNRILNGITRVAVLEVAASRGVRVREQALSIAEAAAADEAFLTGTTAEVTPVVSIDGKPVGNGKPGPVTLQLQGGFRDCVATECA